MSTIPFYDPSVSYESNFEKGPFGGFGSEVSMVRAGIGYDFFGTKVDLPFGIPAGPLLNANFVIAALKEGFDICTYKTVRTRTYPCHPWPNVLSVCVDGDLSLEKAKEALVANRSYVQPVSITNSFGVPSKDPSWWQEDMRKAIDACTQNQVVVGSFQGTGDGTGFSAQCADYVLGADLVFQTGAKVLEANLSCPNEGSAHLLCFDHQRVRDIVFAIKEKIGNIPLIIKIAYFESDEVLSKLIVSIGDMVDGISAINTIPARVINEHGEQALPGKGREVSGICGHAISWAGKDMVSRLKTLQQKYNKTFTILGVGGVTTPQDFFDYQNLGADVVMSATGAMWDPQLALKIKNRIVQNGDRV